MNGWREKVRQDVLVMKSSTLVKGAQTNPGRIRTKARYTRSLKRTRKDLAANNQQQETPKQQYQEQNTARNSIDTMPIPRFEGDALRNRDALKIEGKNKNGTILEEKPLLVLDVNGVLCRRIRSQGGDDAKAIATYRSSLGRVAHTEVVPRTDLQQFLNLLDSHFVLAIWSSAKQKTLKKLIPMLFPSEVSVSFYLFIYLFCFFFRLVLAFLHSCLYPSSPPSIRYQSVFYLCGGKKSVMSFQRHPIQ
jgi:hypothetical protein